MLGHYLKAAARSLYKHRFYTMISVFALSIGLAVAALVIGHVVYECSFEDTHANRARIHRVETPSFEYTYIDERGVERGRQGATAQVLPPLGPALVEGITEIERAAIFRYRSTTDVVVGEDEFSRGPLVIATPELLEVFTLPMLQGNPRTALDDPMTVLLTEETAGELFPGEDPMGKVVNVDGRFECRVTGVLEDIPSNTDVDCDLVVSYASLERSGENLQSWNQAPRDLVYLQLKDDTDPRQVEQKVKAVAARHQTDDSQCRFEVSLRPLDDVHFGALEDRIGGGPGPIGELSLIYAMAMVALFVLIQAIANFVNLSIARASERMREVGVRKVFGAIRAQLIRQYLGESTLVATAAMVLSLAFYELIRPVFNNLLNRDALTILYESPMMIGLLAALVIVTGLLAGFYPALYLSRFKPISILQRRVSFRSSRSLMRRGLVVFQFMIAIVFIANTAIVYQQTKFVTGMNLGFDRENFLLLDFEGERAAENCRLMKSEIGNNCDVLAMTTTDCPPGRMTNDCWGFRPQNDPERDHILTRMYFTDHDFPEAFGLQLTRGRGFSEEILSEVTYPVLVNESAVKALEMGNPIGYRLKFEGTEAEVVGVVEDFHGSTMNYSYRSSSIIMLNPRECNTLAVKLPAGRTSESLSAIKSLWGEILPDQTFRFAFLDDEIEASYAENYMQISVILFLAALTTLIACTGIMGLASLAASQRTREVGIRKVLGASVTSVMRLLTREFVLLVVLANVIAWPIAYMMMQGFLQEYPIRVGLGPGVFLVTGGVVLALAVLSAGMQALRAARSNPVEALRHE